MKISEKILNIFHQKNTTINKSGQYAQTLYKTELNRYDDDLIAANKLLRSNSIYVPNFYCHKPKFFITMPTQELFKIFKCHKYDNSCTNLRVYVKSSSENILHIRFSNYVSNYAFNFVEKHATQFY